MGGRKTLTGITRIEAYKMLHEVNYILKHQKIPYVLEAGTLLGIIRENRLLPWDNDLDITITNASIETLLASQHLFKKAGYTIKLRYFDSDMGPFKKGMLRIIKVRKRSFLPVFNKNLMDIFIKYDIGETYQWVICPKNPVLKKAPKHFYDNRVCYMFDNAEFYIPKDYEGYLEYHYGKDWRVPIKNWDFRLDDFCERELVI